MRDLLDLLDLLTAPITVVAAVGLLAASRALHAPRTLVAPWRIADGTSDARAHATVAAVSVVIPARDEERNLPTLLTSLASCRPAPAEVIVVDDGSSDGTASIARSFGVTVLVAPPLPDGWIGKSWACHQGSLAATRSTLVFLDADTEVAPACFAALQDLVERHGGLVSVQPHHVVPTAREQCSALFNVVSVMGSGAFARHPARAVRLAYGPCLATTIADYERIGGHAAVRGDVVEDIGLAERYAAGGLGVTCVLGGDQLRFRMYPDGIRSLIEGWTKNIATGAHRAPLHWTALTVTWIGALCAVAASLVSVSIDALRGGGAPVAAAAAWIAVAIDLDRKLRNIGSFHRWTSACFIVPLAVFVAVFIRSAAASIRRRPVRWRGRSVPPRAATAP